MVTSYERHGKEYPPLSKYMEGRLFIVLPKGRKQAVEAHASDKGQSVNGLVNALLRADMGLTEDEWKQAPEDAKKAPCVDTEP